MPQSNVDPLTTLESERRLIEALTRQPREAAWIAEVLTKSGISLENGVLRSEANRDAARKLTAAGNRQQATRDTSNLFLPGAGDLLGWLTPGERTRRSTHAEDVGTIHREVALLLDRLVRSEAKDAYVRIVDVLESCRRKVPDADVDAVSRRFADSLLINVSSFAEDLERYRQLPYFLPPAGLPKDPAVSGQEHDYRRFAVVKPLLGQIETLMTQPEAGSDHQARLGALLQLAQTAADTAEAMAREITSTPNAQRLARNLTGQHLPGLARAAEAAAGKGIRLSPPSIAPPIAAAATALAAGTGGEGGRGAAPETDPRPVVGAAGRDTDVQGIRRSG